MTGSLGRIVSICDLSLFVPIYEKCVLFSHDAWGFFSPGLSSEAPEFMHVIAQPSLWHLKDSHLSLSCTKSRKSVVVCV